MIDRQPAQNRSCQGWSAARDPLPARSVLRLAAGAGNLWPVVLRNVPEHRPHIRSGEHMTSSTSEPGWAPIAILVGRLIFLAIFIMAVSFKFMDINGTAGYIAMAGFPASYFLAWCAAIFEVLLVLGFLTGAYFA